MHLGVNAVRFTRKFTGVGRYIECVLKEWSKMEIPFDKVTLYSPSPLSQDNVLFPLEKFNLEVIGTPMPDPLWETLELRKVSQKVDVLFCPSYTVPLMYPGKSMVAYLGPSENSFPEYEWWRSQAYNMLYRYSARKADMVMVCSQSVKDRVTDVFKVSENKVKITYLCPSDVFKKITDDKVLRETTEKYLRSQEPFILFVGKLAKRHYIPNLLEAFAKIKNDNKIPHKLLIAGPDYLDLNVPARAEKLGIGNDVVYTPFITHVDLPPVYNAAQLFIFPASHAEGFGIPVIEAMACGTPVISVNQGSIAEFAPGAALLTEDSSVDQLANAMAKMISDPDLRTDLAAKGLERAKSITWKITAEKTMNELWKLAKS